MSAQQEIPRRSEAIAAHRAQGGGVAAVFPIHYPRALLRAFDLLPVEVWGPPKISTQSGDGHLQAYTCSVVRCALSFLLDGGLRDVDVLVSPHACDSLQGLGSLLLDFVKPEQLVLPLYIPRGSGESDVAYLADELRVAFDKLATRLDRRPDDDALKAAVAAEEEADAALNALLDALPSAVEPSGDIYRLLRAREYLPAEQFCMLAAERLASWATQLDDAAATKRRDAKVPLLLSGLLPEPMALFDAFEELGVRIVADDQACVGRRAYPPGRSAEPFRRMAEALLAGPPDPTRGCSVTQRAEHLVAQARQSGASGVLFYDVKFCEPELFYLPLTRQALERAGLRSLAVEVDIADPLSDQLLTRIEAFVESLEDGR